MLDKPVYLWGLWDWISCIVLAAVILSVFTGDFFPILVLLAILNFFKNLLVG